LDTLTHKKGNVSLIELNFNPTARHGYTGWEQTLRKSKGIKFSKKVKLTLHQVQAWLGDTIYDSKPAYKNQVLYT